MKRTLIRLVLGVPLLLALALCGALLYAHVLVVREREVPYPNVKADLSPEGLARGAAIFHPTCEGCHRGVDSQRASGSHLTELPAFLGTFYSANLTSHPTAGIGRLTDAQVARMIRFSVNRHGRLGLMPASHMSDADLAAVIGYLRSNDPMFAPSDEVRPRSRLSASGKLMLLLSGTIGVPDPESLPKSILTPPKGPTVEYGRYLANNRYDCVNCHTAGFAPDKGKGETAFAGGTEMRQPNGQPIRTANLTFDETGLASWTAEDLLYAVRDGIRRDGTAVRAPMPRFRGIDETDARALHAYLSSLPKRRNAMPRTPAPQIAHRGDPARMFAQLGCTSCHAPGAQFHAKLANAKGKNTEDVARWIRNAGEFRPGTPMPTYAKLIDEESAVRLARYVQGL